MKTGFSGEKLTTKLQQFAPQIKWLVKVQMLFLFKYVCSKFKFQVHLFIWSKQACYN